jgi:hypothetical protein
MFSGDECGREEVQGRTPSRLGYTSVHESQPEELRGYEMFARDFVRISPMFFVYIFIRLPRC